MSDQTLFESEQQTTETQTSSEAAPADQQTAAPATDPYNNLLQGIKTDDGRQKYATVSDALNSIGPKEQHIMTLESENSTLREQMESLKADFEAFKATAEATRTNTDTGESQTETANTAIDVDTLVAQVSQHLSAQEQQKVSQQRLTQFKEKLVQQYGEKAKDVYMSKLKEAGVPEQVVMQTAAHNPDAAWKFLGLDTTQTVESNSVPTSTRNTQATETRQEQPQYKFRQTGKPAPGSTMAQLRAEKLKELGSN